jgi:hypothetical protein
MDGLEGFSFFIDYQLPPETRYHDLYAIVQQLRSDTAERDIAWIAQANLRYGSNPRAAEQGLRVDN